MLVCICFGWWLDAEWFGTAWLQTGLHSTQDWPFSMQAHYLSEVNSKIQRNIWYLHLTWSVNSCVMQRLTHLYFIPKSSRYSGQWNISISTQNGTVKSLIQCKSMGFIHLFYHVPAKITSLFLLNSELAAWFDPANSACRIAIQILKLGV